MESRISYAQTVPEALKALLGVSNYVHQSGLEPELVDLISLRASQINGCAYCIDMHWKDLRARGVSEETLYMLDAWQEAPGYTERERAALAWTEAVTKLEGRQVPEEVYAQARKQFADRDLVNLTVAVTAINSWNRINIAFRTPSGRYQPPAEIRKAETIATTR